MCMCNDAKSGWSYDRIIGRDFLLPTFFTSTSTHANPHFYGAGSISIILATRSILLVEP
jgi:hypothetical protein